MGLLGSELVFMGGDHLGRENSQVRLFHYWNHPLSFSLSLPQWSEKKSISLVSFNLGELLQYLQSLVRCPLTSFLAFVYFLLKNHYPPKKRRHEASSVGH